MSQTTVQNATPQASSVVEKPAIKCGIFHGAMSRFQVTAFSDLIYAKIDRHVSHKIAQDFGSDLGRLMSTDATLATRIGKADKSGMSRITLSGGGKVATSRSMSTIRVAQEIDRLYVEGLLANREMPTLHPTLVEYVTECEKWAADQNWEKKNP